METVTMIIRLPNVVNEILLDEVAKRRKQGVKSSKEKIILEIINDHLKQ